MAINYEGNGSRGHHSEFEPDRNGLTWLARNLGYESIEDLTRRNGYSSLNALAESYGFRNIGDFLSEPGLYARLDTLRR